MADKVTQDDQAVVGVAPNGGLPALCFASLETLTLAMTFNCGIWLTNLMQSGGLLSYDPASTAPNQQMAGLVPIVGACLVAIGSMAAFRNRGKMWAEARPHWRPLSAGMLLIIALGMLSQVFKVPGSTIWSPFGWN